MRRFSGLVPGLVVLAATLPLKAPAHHSRAYFGNDLAGDLGESILRYDCQPLMP